MSRIFAELDRFWAVAVDWAWGMPLVVLLISAGIFFTLRGGFPPARIRHAIDVLRGKFDDPNDPGEISHFQALSAALSATIGMGNIAGVAIAISAGGPGAVFWMWIAGLVGMSTKFFTCTLACLYRKEDHAGVPQGGPMYFIEVGLGPRFKPLALLFAVCGMIGCLALFQINQLAGLLSTNHQVPKLLTGMATMVLVAAVILGGIKRVGTVAAKVVPAMAALYALSALLILVRNAAALPRLLGTIFQAAFGGGAMLGGAAAVTFKETLITGVRRAAFSNEAGIGTAPMAHGAAKTDEPVREGLIAMLGPLIDTNVICTMTALVILVSGVGGSTDGAVLTARAFDTALPGLGAYLLSLAIVLFAVSTMISYSYYSEKCAKYLLGPRIGSKYIYVYLLTIPLAAVWTQTMVVNMLDTAFAMMAIPTLVGTLLLSSRVRSATVDYFTRMGEPAGG